ncbi:unnamed protein product [Acanthosepion pharaonis]|uniref:Uncharacterized protein n=1 Tax=Acanthosepion pharaonis TaxID=158019 RepID=A0A812DK97_ACAPH|nr:unnamed protein product [Sepia pharaonis]
MIFSFPCPSKYQAFPLSFVSLPLFFRGINILQDLPLPLPIISVSFPLFLLLPVFPSIQPKLQLPLPSLSSLLFPFPLMISGPPSFLNVSLFSCLFFLIIILSSSLSTPDSLPLSSLFDLPSIQPPEYHLLQSLSSSLFVPRVNSPSSSSYEYLYKPFPSFPLFPSIHSYFRFCPFLPSVPETSLPLSDNVLLLLCLFSLYSTPASFPSFSSSLSLSLYSPGPLSSLCIFPSPGPPSFYVSQKIICISFLISSHVLSDDLLSLFPSIQPLSDSPSFLSLNKLLCLFLIFPLIISSLSLSFPPLFLSSQDLPSSYSGNFSCLFLLINKPPSLLCLSFPLFNPFSISFLINVPDSPILLPQSVPENHSQPFPPPYFLCPKSFSFLFLSFPSIQPMNSPSSPFFHSVPIFSQVSS